MTHVQVSSSRVSYAIDETDVSKAFDIALRMAEEYVVIVTVTKDGTPTVSITRRQSHK